MGLWDDAKLLGQQSCRISSRSDLKRWSLGLFKEVDPRRKKKKNNNKMTRNMGSIAAVLLLAAERSTADAERATKPCPQCRREVRLSPFSRRFLRQSHFSTTVWTGLKSALYAIARPSVRPSVCHTGGSVKNGSNYNHATFTTQSL